jgi:hypothetical protein
LAGEIHRAKEKRRPDGRRPENNLIRPNSPSYFFSSVATEAGGFAAGGFAAGWAGGAGAG